MTPLRGKMTPLFTGGKYLPCLQGEKLLPYSPENGGGKYGGKTG